MYDNDGIDKAAYSSMMEELKKINHDYISIRKSKEYRIGKLIMLTIQYGKALKFSSLFKTYSKLIQLKNAKKYNGTAKSLNFCEKSNYFCKDRIAVYMVVFGEYDQLTEPYCSPDNIDYWIITDQNYDLSHSKWKKYDISGFEKELEGLNNIEKNRYFKMHPMTVFDKYRYSLYVDGNVQIITDVTEYVYHIGKTGISVHMHRCRDCVYEEAEAVVQAKKATRAIIDKHIQHLRECGFPQHYGLLECNVIMREHTLLCKKIMDEWWFEFLTNSRRDQLSLPYVLYKNNVAVDDVGTMGNNVMNNLSFRINVHN